MKKLTILTLLLIAAMATSLSAQTKYIVGKSTAVKVTGTSTLHDWHMETKSTTGTAQFVIENGELKNLQQLSLSIPAESIKSDKESMDNNAYKSLNTSKYATITFQLTKFISLTKTGTNYNLVCEGKLQLSGVTKVIKLEAVCTLDANGTIRAKGEKALKMSEYNIEPPSFMFGSVKTGDDVKIIFDVTLTKN